MRCTSVAVSSTSYRTRRVMSSTQTRTPSTSFFNAFLPDYVHFSRELSSPHWQFALPDQWVLIVRVKDGKSLHLRVFGVFCGAVRWTLIIIIVFMTKPPPIFMIAHRTTVAAFNGLSTSMWKSTSCQSLKSQLNFFYSIYLRRTVKILSRDKLSERWKIIFKKIIILWRGEKIVR